MAERQLWTIGHSTHTQLHLVGLLVKYNINLLVDVRTIPRSSRNPQFNKDTLSEDLPQHGIKYVWMGKELGGLRKRNKEMHLNDGWENFSFRGYADYMQTPAFREGIQQLKQLAAQRRPAAIMCAEAMYFSCHRRLISDALTASGWQVWHIMPQDNTPPAKHTITPWAQVQGNNVIYPAAATTPPPESAAAPTAATAAAAKQRHRSKKPSAAAATLSGTQAACNPLSAAGPTIKTSTAGAAADEQEIATNSIAAAEAHRTAGSALEELSADALAVKPSAAVGDGGGASYKSSRRTQFESRKQLRIDQMMHRQLSNSQ